MSFTLYSYKEFLSWNNNKVRPPESPYQIDIPFQEYLAKNDYTKLKPNQIYITRMIKEFRDEYIKILIFLTTPSEIKKFLNYHFIKYKGIKEDFIYFVEWTISDLKTISFNQQMSHFENYIYQIIKDWAMEKRSELNAENTESKANSKQLEKIKWMGSPAVFGFIILELVKKGFIEPPLYNGEPNFTGLARLFYDYFDIATTLGYFTDQLSEKKNNLSDTKRSKFTIPNLSDLA